MAKLTMLSSTRKKVHLLSIGLICVAALATVVAYFLEVMSAPLTIVALIAQLLSIGAQIGIKPDNTVAPAVVEDIPTSVDSTPTTSESSYQISDFLNANLRVLDGELKASVPFPKGVRAEDKELVKSFVKRIRLAGRDLNTTVEAPIDPVATHTGTAPSSVLGLARDLEGQIQKGNGALRHGQESVRELRDLLVESSSRLRRVRDHSRSVRDGVELVKDLSEQTNVLALNAAIQASRSGEDGLGVVAEELQRVAVRGADSGRKLEEQLEALRDDLSDTMAAITRGEQGVSVTLQSNEAVQEAYSLVEKTSSEIAQIARNAN